MNVKPATGNAPVLSRRRVRLEIDRALGLMRAGAEDFRKSLAVMLDEIRAAGGMDPRIVGDVEFVRERLESVAARLAETSRDLAKRSSG